MSGHAIILAVVADAFFIKSLREFKSDLFWKGKISKLLMKIKTNNYAIPAQKSLDENHCTFD